MSFPANLKERIEEYLKSHNEQWDESKHHIFIDVTQSPPKLIIEKWNYNCKLFSLKNGGTQTRQDDRTSERPETKT